MVLFRVLTWFTGIPTIFVTIFILSFLFYFLMGFVFSGKILSLVSNLVLMAEY